MPKYSATEADIEAFTLGPQYMLYGLPSEMKCIVDQPH